MVWKTIRDKAFICTGLGYLIGAGFGFVAGSLLGLELPPWVVAASAFSAVVGLYALDRGVGALRTAVARVEEDAENWVEFQAWTARAKQVGGGGEEASRVTPFVVVDFESAEWEPGKD